jgi:choline-sulfatase
MKKNPNILFLFSDQHAQRIAGMYGDPIALTPNLDRLARSGVTFDNAYCPSPLCVPSRMSMLTGKHPYAQECWTNDDYLRSDNATWLHAVGAVGYRPSLIGRLHSMGPDQMHGYAEREVGDHSPNWIGVRRHNLGVLNRTNDPWPDSVIKSGVGQSSYEVKDVATMEAACGKLRQLGEARRRGQDAPFCLTAGFLLPHPPYVASAEDYALFAAKVGAPADWPAGAMEHSWLRWWRQNRQIAGLPEDAVVRARTAYYALVYRLDKMIGAVLQALEEEGLAEDTLIAYTSDHGDHVGEKACWWKHTLYEESVKVPLILSWPERLPANVRREQVVNLIDVAATFVDAAGAPPLPNAQGHSLLPIARDASAPWNNQTFSEYCTDVVPEWTGGQMTRQRMIRRGDWKLIYYADHPVQLFNLREDPEERQDRANDPRAVGTKEDLLGRVLDGWDAEKIRDTIVARRRDKELIGAWARNVEPADQYRWSLDAELNQLANEPAVQQPHGSPA